MWAASVNSCAQLILLGERTSRDGSCSYSVYPTAGHRGLYARCHPPWQFRYESDFWRDVLDAFYSLSFSASQAALTSRADFEG